VDSFSRPWQDDIDSSQWLELLHPFTAVKELHISKFTQSIAPALQELIGERGTEVLLALQSLLLEEPLPSAVEEAIVSNLLPRDSLPATQ
jgi:hypothetical protein